MSTPSTHRPKWAIDRTLDGLIGQDGRVAAKAFTPPTRKDHRGLVFMPVGELFLPDNSQAGDLPVLFEGLLVRFDRRIGVVCVHLDSLTSRDGSSEGTANFRGKLAVILRGPAVVQLAFPFHVERLPTDEENYWRDLKAPRAQFVFTFARDEG
jgi:hypothetical protein